jgi:group I intron endonuclease
MAYKEKKQNWYTNPRKYHFIYKTTCSVNGKYYYGMHSTDDLEDGYIGSGTYLAKSVRKHGRENFKLEILEFCLDRENLKQREAELITEEMLNDPMCMNLRLGGHGGWEIVHQRLKTDQEFKKRHSNSLSRSHQYRKGILFNDKRCDWTGRNHSEETKKKISESNKLNHLGDRNSQFGRYWCHNPISGEIKRLLHNEEIPSGWRKGKVSKVIEEKIDHRRILAESLFDQFKNGNFLSVSDFCRKGYYDKSIVSLTKMWKKYVTEYESKQGKSFRTLG